MPAPPIRLSCCLCGKPLAQKATAYALDAEWRRRHPDMVGMLACRCAIGGAQHWWCEDSAEHIPVVDDDAPECSDSWSHIEMTGTLVAAVTSYPDSALLQGSEDYLRHTAYRRGQRKDVTEALHTAIVEWEQGSSVQSHIVTKSKS